MKIKIVFDLDEESRRAIAHYYGDKKLASRERCFNHIVMCVEADLESLQSELPEKEGE